LKVFVSFTNVALSAGEKDALIEHGKANGVQQTDIFDRERIRIHLDSPEGLAVRYQYLAIPLSDAEQAAFFARWGSELETLISKSVNSLQDRLSRIEFSSSEPALLNTSAITCAFQSLFPKPS